MASQVLITVGERIKDIRRELRMQQKELAQTLGVSNSHLSEVESGKTSASTDFYTKLSTLHNVSVEYIFHGRGPMFYAGELKMSDEITKCPNNVDTLDKLILLAKNSPFFKSAILFQATKLALTDKELIQRSMIEQKEPV